MKKIYLIAISCLIAASIYAADKKVMVVSEEDPSTADGAINQMFIDKISELDGITAEWVSMADLGTVTYTNYHAAVITENGGSSNMRAYGDAGWPLPTVHLKIYAIYQGTNPLIPEAAFINGAKQATLPAGVADLKVLDNSDVLCEYSVDDVVTWTDGYNTDVLSADGSGEAHVQGFDLSQSETADIVSNAVALAESPYLANAGLVPAIHTFMWKLEENSVTKRCVFWGIHNGFCEKATDDFWGIIQNATLWVLGEETCAEPEPDAINEATTSIFSIYPNPVADILNINNASIITSVDIIDITGKVINNVQNENNALLQISTQDLNNGMYMLRIQTTDGNTYMNKLLK